MGLDFPAQILVIEPFFEEANRCRRFIATMMRALDCHGIGSAIAPLPGCGESLIKSGQYSISAWREAVQSAALSLGATHIASFRGGALVDTTNIALPVWRFAPETGVRISRDLERTRLAGTSNLYAGHPIPLEFLKELRAVEAIAPANLRTIRLEGDSLDADLNVSGSPLWRRAEPGEDPALSILLADDLANWVKSCAIP
jgi:hypothetical protein